MVCLPARTNISKHGFDNNGILRISNKESSGTLQTNKFTPA